MQTEVWYCKYWVIALEGHLGIWVAKWSVVVPRANNKDPQLRDQMASRATKLLTSLAA